MIRNLCIVALLALCPVFYPIQVEGQTPEAGNSPLKAFEELVVRNPKAASYGSIAFTEEMRIEEMDSCSIRMVTISQMGSSDETLSLDVDLRKYSPEVAVKKWNDDELWSVRGYTSSGKDETHLARTGSNPIDGYRNFFELVFGREVTANQARSLLSEAISRCGGRASLAATAASKKQNEVSPEAVELYPGCQKMVSAQLRAPTTATFPAVASLSVTKDEKEGTLSLSGYVTGENGFGASVTKLFICNYEKAGDSWVPSGRPLIL
jgi:hypothetical protein